MTTPISDTELLLQYLDVCNTAIAANKDSFPRRQVLALSRLLFSGHNFSVLLYDEDADLRGHFHRRLTAPFGLQQSADGPPHSSGVGCGELTSGGGWNGQLAYAGRHRGRRRGRAGGDRALS